MPASLYPGALLFAKWETMFLDDGVTPAVGSTVNFYTAGTSTPLDTYSDSDLDPSHVNANPITLDSEGRFPVAVYLQATGYKVTFTDTAAVVYVTQDEVEDNGQVFAANFGYLASIGSKAVTSGYTILTTDRLVTVNSTGGPNPCIINLPNATTLSQMFVIKNVGTIPVAVTPTGIQTIEGINSAYTIAAASSPAFPSKIFVSDLTSNYWVLNVA